jgi:hypothetical protein
LTVFVTFAQDYRENANPINKKPIKLWQYDLGTDHRYAPAVR